MQCVRYAPDGSIFVSAGSDGKLFVYEGKEGDKVSELTDNGHSGSIYSFAFCQDSKKIISASADSTVKLWDLTTQKVISTCNFGDSSSAGVESQQVGCLWTKNHMLSVSLSGEINYLSEQSFNSPSKVLRGHQKGITTLAVGKDQ